MYGSESELIVGVEMSLLFFFFFGETFLGVRIGWLSTE